MQLGPLDHRRVHCNPTSTARSSACSPRQGCEYPKRSTCDRGREARWPLGPKTKFGKESVASPARNHKRAPIESYLTRRLSEAGCCPFVFVSIRGSKLHGNTARGVFRRLVYRLGLARPEDKLRPRLHDLRFYFANQAPSRIHQAIMMASDAIWSPSRPTSDTATSEIVIGTLRQLRHSSRRSRPGVRTLRMEGTYDTACASGHRLLPQAPRN